MVYLLLFLFGLIAANGVPHFIKGVTGEMHMTPFGRPSPAVVNALWGTANFYLAAWLLYWAAKMDYQVFGASLAIVAGVLVTALGLAKVWSGDDQARGHEEE